MASWKVKTIVNNSLLSQQICEKCLSTLPYSWCKGDPDSLRVVLGDTHMEVLKASRNSQIWIWVWSLTPQLSLGPEYGETSILSYLKPTLDVVGVFAPCWYPCMRIWSSWNHLTSFSKISGVELCRDRAWDIVTGHCHKGETPSWEILFPH